MQFDYKPAVAKISGQALSIIGTVSATLVGGTITASVSGQRVYFANDGINNVVRISGQTVSIAGAVTVNIPNDSINNVIKISGQTVNIQGGVNISGQKVYLADDGLNNVVKISGQTVFTGGGSVVPNAMVSVSNTSGGTQLPSIPCVKAYVRSTSGNGVMFVGGTGANAPFSGKGLELYGGEVLPIDVTNVNAVSLVSTINNEKVSIMVVA